MGGGHFRSSLVVFSLFVIVLVVLCSCSLSWFVLAVDVAEREVAGVGDASLGCKGIARARASALSHTNE